MSKAYVMNCKRVFWRFLFPAASSSSSPTPSAVVPDSFSVFVSCFVLICIFSISGEVGFFFPHLLAFYVFLRCSFFPLWHKGLSNYKDINRLYLANTWRTKLFSNEGDR